jgi:hypothetical protein
LSGRSSFEIASIWRTQTSALADNQRVSASPAAPCSGFRVSRSEFSVLAFFHGLAFFRPHPSLPLCLPVFYTQAWNPSELPHVVGYKHGAESKRMPSQEYIVRADHLGVGF